MRLLTIVVVAPSLMFSIPGCAPHARSHPQDAEGEDSGPCVGIECQLVDCAKQGLPATMLSGTVYAPNGTLALYGAQIYVPLVDPGPFPAGVQCSHCTTDLPGGAVAHTVSDEAGRFILSGVPAGTEVPLFITIGKWRRKVVLPSVTACADNPLPEALTSLPKNRSEGDLPKIAIATGAFDALECLVRKLGVSDAEFTPSTGDGSIHLYAINGANHDTQGATFTSASALWNNLDAMKQYDIALFSCEGDEYPQNKPQAAMDIVKAYADAGGRLFLSHFQNVWIAGDEANPSHAPAGWSQIATCNGQTQTNGSYTGYIDQIHNPKGTTFAQWMMNVMGSSTSGLLPIQDFRETCTAVDDTKAERWVYMTYGSHDYPSDFQFTTPNEIDVGQRCGKVVFSDMHVAGDSMSKPEMPFPMGCSAAPLIPQEKALAFMFFDIASCVGPIF